MRTVAGEEFTRSCYCRRGYGGKIKVCGCGPVRDKRWYIVEDGKRVPGYFLTKRDAKAWLEREVSA